MYVDSCANTSARAHVCVEIKWSAVFDQVSLVLFEFGLRSPLTCKKYVELAIF